MNMKILRFPTPGIPMRIPTDDEWDRLLSVVNRPPHVLDLEIGGRLDWLIHWSAAFFWVNASMDDKSQNRMTIGYHYPDWRFAVPASSKSNFFRFRPAFDLAPGALPDVKNGEMVVVGTLYMGEEPIRVPSCGEGPANYHRSAASLSIRPALEDPHYQVVALRAGNTLIADKPLLKKISYEDIERLGLAVRHGDDAIPVSIGVQDIFV